MKDKIKKLKSKLKLAKESWVYVSTSIKKVLRKNPNISPIAKHYLFQCQVILHSNKLLLKKYEKKILRLSNEDSLSSEEFEYIAKTLINLITDHQAKSISLSNLFKGK